MTMKEHRKKLGMTALQLGQAAGIGEMRVFHLERGRFPPHLDEAKRIASALGEKPEALFPELYPVKGRPV